MTAAAQSSSATFHMTAELSDIDPGGDSVV